MVVGQLQGLLARLYDVSSDYAVADFLITDRAQAATFHAAPLTDEQVLLREADDELHIGVYIDDAVVDRLNRSNPIEQLNDRNLTDYCTALEGVSHFHYLTWRAACSEPVSLLELELQAEVDKYAAAVRLCTRQQCGRFPRELHERMFHHVRFHADLDDESAARYRNANRCAARFCRRLDERYLHSRRAKPESWLRELRSFYRLPHAQKLRAAQG